MTPQDYIVSDLATTTIYYIILFFSSVKFPGHIVVKKGEYGGATAHVQFGEWIGSEKASAEPECFQFWDHTN